MKNSKSFFLFLITMGMSAVMVLGLFFPFVTYKISTSYYGYSFSGTVKLLGFTIAFFSADIFSYGYEWAGVVLGLICLSQLIVGLVFAGLTLYGYFKNTLTEDAMKTRVRVGFIYLLVYASIGFITVIVAGEYYYKMMTYNFIPAIVAIGLFIAFRILYKKIQAEGYSHTSPVTSGYQNQNYVAPNQTSPVSPPAPSYSPSGEKIIFSAEGAQKVLTVYEDRITLQQMMNIRSLLTHDLLKGTKEIYYENILSINMKAASNIILGYIQFELPGSGTGNNFGSENSWTFNEKQNELANQIVAYIKGRIKELKKPQSAVIQQSISAADEIKKYKELLDAGIISQEEFEEKKNDLLKK